MTNGPMLNTSSLLLYRIPQTVQGRCRKGLGRYLRGYAHCMRREESPMDEAPFMEK